MSDEIILSKETMELVDHINQPKIKKFIEYYTQEQKSLWIEAYNVIKTDDWPECNDYDDFEKLPKIIIDECINQHNFSPDIWKNNVIEKASIACKISENVFSRMEKFHRAFWLKENLEIFKDKKVVDLACNVGLHSSFLYLNGCKDIIGADIRQDNIKIANAIKRDINAGDDLRFVCCDLHDYDSLSNLCADRDVALFMGVLYHVHDHYNILEAICRSNIKHLIIETIENDSIMDDSKPMIYYKTEPTFEHIAGHYKTMDKILVGYPNRSWLKVTMDLLGFKEMIQTKYVDDPLDPDVLHRTFYLFERK